MIEITDALVLIEVVDQGSLAAAGRRLGLAPMAVSRRLAALEAELGVRLVHRSTRSLSLTPEGEIFLPHARTLVAQEGDARAALAPAGQGATGILRITASNALGRKLVMPMVAPFQRANPDLGVELILSDELVDITGRGIDLALRTGALRDSTLIGRQLADNVRSLYAAPAYLAHHGVPCRLSDLARHECLSHPGATHWIFERNGKPVQQKIGGRFSSNSVEALHLACLDGAGIARMSSWNVREDVESGRLVPVALADADMAKEAIWALHPSTSFTPARVRIFSDAFRAHLGLVLPSDRDSNPRD